MLHRPASRRRPANPTEREARNGTPHASRRDGRAGAAQMAVDRRSLDRAPPPAPPPRRAAGHARLGVGRTPTPSSDTARSQAAVSDAGSSRRELAAVAVALL